MAMHKLSHMNSLPNDQRGATLVVALILLILISLIGVSTLKSASVVEKLSSNDYRKNITFRASESAVDTSLTTNDLISQVIGQPNPITDTIDINIDDATADVTYSSVGEGPVLGASIASSNAIIGERIMITSAATINGDDNSSTRTMHLSLIHI